jgi:hypothetical protein
VFCSAGRHFTFELLPGALSAALLQDHGDDQDGDTDGNAGVGQIENRKAPERDEVGYPPGLQ